MAKAGNFRDRAVIQRLNTAAVDAYGNVSTGWSTLVTRWADIRERTGKEEIEGGALAGVNKATMRVRSDAITNALTEADRVSVRGSLWNIRSIIQSNRQNSIVEMIIEKGIAT
jgi:SPP1 family predicted phage head-tail adaptor|tara:strand:- start:63 stop:401 length:339 start_codon:yes stop_codon:yes gene_type:complete